MKKSCGNPCSSVRGLKYLEQLFGLHRSRLVAQENAVRETRRNLRAGEQHRRQPGAVGRGAAALQEHADVWVVLRKAEVPQEFGREARHIRGLAADFGDQSLHRDARGLVQLRLRGEWRRRVFGDTRRVPIDLRAVVKSLRAGRLAQCPLRLASLRAIARRQAEAARHEVFIEQRKAGSQGRDAQRCLHRCRPRLEAHRGLDVPDLRLFLRAQREAEHVHLVEEQREAEQRQHGRQRVDVAIIHWWRCNGAPSLHQQP
jgi:hypothetical protein